MRDTAPFSLAYFHRSLPSVLCALLLGAASRSAAEDSTTPAVHTATAASDAFFDSPPSVYFEPDWELALQSSKGEALPVNPIGDSIRVAMNGSSLTASFDTLTALITCSESNDSLRLLLVEDSANAGMYRSGIIPIRRAGTNTDENEGVYGDVNLDCLEPDILEVKYTDSIYGTVRVLSVEIPAPAPVPLRGLKTARAGSLFGLDGLLQGGDLGSRPPEDIACFDVRGAFRGWAAPIGAGVWRLPAGIRPGALRLRYPDGASRLETVLFRR